MGYRPRTCTLTPWDSKWLNQCLTATLAWSKCWLFKNGNPKIRYGIKIIFRIVYYREQKINNHPISLEGCLENCFYCVIDCVYLHTWNTVINVWSVALCRYWGGGGGGGGATPQQKMGLGQNIHTEGCLENCFNFFKETVSIRTRGTLSRVF